MNIASASPCGMDDRREVVLRVLPGNEVKINSEDHTRGDLDRRLEEIFRTRVVRLVFIMADPAVQFRDFVEVADTAAKRVDYVAVVTPSVAAAVENRAPEKCLDANIRVH